MNMNSFTSDQDSGQPAEVVNRAYEALKANPAATQQYLQQGPSAGLAWLGAAGAQRAQLRAQREQQMGQAAQFGQTPQPTVAEQLQMAAMQGGIMGQLPGNIQMAQTPQEAPQGGMGLGDIPVDPRTLPQTMAGGGLVALAEGGYLDADGGMGYEPVGENYAEGGGLKVHQYPWRTFGETVSPNIIDDNSEDEDAFWEDMPDVDKLERQGVRERRDPREAPFPADPINPYNPEVTQHPGFDKARSYIDEGLDFVESLPGETAKLNQYLGQKVADKAAEAKDRWAKRLEPWANKVEEIEARKGQPKPEADRGGRNGEVPASQESVKNPKAKPNKEATKTDKAFKKSMSDDNHLATRTVSNAPAETKPAERRGDTPSELRAQYDEASVLYGSGSPQAMALRERINRAERNIQQAEGTAENQAQAQGQTVSAPGGLASIQGQQPAGTQEYDDITAMVDKLKTLRGIPAGMSPEERAWRQEQIESSKADKWLQTLTAMGAGTFAGGGRNWPEAIGQGALYGLSAYRQGSQAETEAELGMLSANAAYEKAQIDAQRDAADKAMGYIQTGQKYGSDMDVARLKERGANTREEYKAQNKAAEKELDRAAAQLRAETMATGRNEATGAQLINARATAEKMAQEELAARYGSLSLVPPGELGRVTNEKYNSILQSAGVSNPGLGGGQGMAGGMGVGNRPTITRQGGLQSPSAP